VGAGGVDGEVFSFHQIALTGVVAAIAAYGALRLAARELRERDDVAVGVLVGLATFALRWFGNIPLLNDDIGALMSPNDCLGFPAAVLAGLLYWAVWPFGGERPALRRAWRWALWLGLVGFVVNVAVI
jgi:hypothetical protein